MVRKGGSRYLIGKKDVERDEYVAHQKNSAEKKAAADKKAAGKESAQTTQET